MFNEASLLQIWGKRDRETDAFYPLIFHMIDTAIVANQMWHHCLHTASKDFICTELQLNSDKACKLISLWIGLHDIGKATPDFQCIGKTKLHRIHHGPASACILQSLFQSNLNAKLAKDIAVVLGGHHGVFPTTSDIKEARSNIGKEQWNEVRSELYQTMIDNLKVCEWPCVTETGNAFLMFLAGLTSVSDWIASNDRFFPYEMKHSTAEHLDYVKGKARYALENLGWTGWKPAAKTVEGLNQLFPFIASIRPLQQEVMNLAKTCCNQPGIVIIEAPMGEGKTEAAIYLADTWVATLKQRGYYFALPTMATSNQMFGRVRDYLGTRYGSKRVNLMLQHGHASLSEEFETLKHRFELRHVDEDAQHSSYDGTAPGIVASEWFTYRKRGLLSPFGVGTIDQALLAVLQTRHVFVRLFGLVQKTIIIDEVHAYDAYMSTLLERLLEWLAALDCSVVLLSATLPKVQKNALLGAYRRGLGQANVAQPVNETSYPRISWYNGSAIDVKKIDTSAETRKDLILQWVNGRFPDGITDFELGERLQEALQDGGCAAVICNTVDQAQKTYTALKKYFPNEDAGDGQPELDLLHARYLFGDRKAREERSLKRFGKDRRNRPARAVLVATQIIEQSLDLDFDLMVTEMAPADLLLQRAGRLHRHNNDRPEKLKTPTLWICQPEMKDEVPEFGPGTEAVYDPHILLRSWLAIADYVGKKPVMIPENVESLIEKVYGEQDCTDTLKGKLRISWEKSKGKLEAERSLYEIKAKTNRILSPYYEDEILEVFNRELEEDNPNISDIFQALTRLSKSQSISFICLYGDTTEPRCDTLSEPLDTQTRPDVLKIKKLLNKSVQLSHKTIVNSLTNSSDSILPRAWRKDPLLRHHYWLFFDEKGLCTTKFTDYTLSLDDELGLVIIKN